MNFPEMIFAVVRRLAPFLFGASVLFFIGVLVWLTPHTEEVMGETEEVVIPRETSGRTQMYSAADFEEEAHLREVLIEERGGRVSLARLKSLRFSGEVGTGSVARDFSLLTMAPDLIHIRVSGNGEQLNLGYDGKEYWKFLGMDDGTRQGLDPNPIEVDLMMALGRVHGPLLQEFLDGQGRVVSVEDVADETGRVLRIQFIASGSQEIEQVDLDPLDLNLLRWEKKDPLGNALVLSYSGYREVNGFYEPSKVEFWRNGDKELELEVSSVVPNFGAVRLLFRNPISG
ncbi:hypothetical protein [Puniceicoccus vermicola]|uniref:DUF4292 domain-containing protein n=1 Tax=Puniceicoccus vermicola TaxID=388746 RepID=A0A7X1B1W1_9BACT|nr:hypothetical protein [Puniceicoccus vermicola]MBC2604105.1 hypothetical protein [Puniceicoccus vermicola]